MKIYVYGTGCGAGDLTDEALPASRIEAFVEREGGGLFLGRPVISPEALAGRDFDLLIVASREAERIARELEELGIDPGKVSSIPARSFISKTTLSPSTETAMIRWRPEYWEMIM